MTRHWFLLTTLAPVVATSSSATVGASRSLPYLPGASLLGAVAAQLYSPLATRSADLAVRVFHRGAARFGDALPCRDAGSAIVPVPLCFHHPKGDDCTPAWRNHVVEEVLSTEQPTQVRDGYLDGTVAEGEDPRLRPRMESSERTAMKDGMVRDGFLYSLHAISAGQRFLTAIDLSDDLPSDIKDTILATLAGELRVGRSRSAEFGLVRSEPLLEPPTDVPLAPRPHRDHVPILLTSDWCLLDLATGAPTLRLRPDTLGLPPAAFQVIPEATFVRTRRYSPFNGTRRRPDHERQVLAQGSVITVRLGAGTTLDELRAAVDTGVGQHLAEGLGRALVSPAFLHERTLRRWRQSTHTEEDGTLAQLALRADPTFAWARARTQAMQETEEALQVARQWRHRLEDASSHTLSRSQWGRIRAIALEASTPQQLSERLRAAVILDPDKRGINKLRGGGWGSRTRSGAQTLGEVFMGLVDRADAHQVRATVILAGLMVRQ